MGKLNKKQLIQLVEKIRNREFHTEEERHELLEEFLHNVPDPQATNLIYYHKPRLTPKEIVEKALAYKAIILILPDDKIDEISKTT